MLYIVAVLYGKQWLFIVLFAPVVCSGSFVFGPCCLTLLSSGCYVAVIVLCLFLMIPWVALWYLVLSGHIRLLSVISVRFSTKYGTGDEFGNLLELGNSSSFCLRASFCLAFRATWRPTGFDRRSTSLFYLYK